MSRQARHMPLSRLLKGKKGTISKTLVGGIQEFQAKKEFSLVLPKGSSGFEKIGTVCKISRITPKTVWVACDSPVYWPKYGRTFLKSNRIRAHNETESLAIGDIVHMTAVAKMEDKKAHNVDYVVKPNLEARLRRLQGLPDIPESVYRYRKSKKRPKPPGTTIRSRVLKPIKDQYLQESPHLLQLGVWKDVGPNVRGLQRDQDRREQQELRKMERLAIRARIMAEAAEHDAQEAAPRRPVFRSPSQYPLLG
eukprot:EG_transcript_22412